MDRETFGRLVREALENLHDRPSLAAHPLGEWLGPGREPLDGDALRRELLGAIEQLRPMGSVEFRDASWRRYRHLLLRYVEGHSLEQVADLLGVSVRQASRDHQQGLASLVSLLWARRGDLDETRLTMSPDESRIEKRAAPSDNEDLASEVAKVAASERGVASLLDILDGVLGTMSKLAEERGVSFGWSVPDTLPPVAMSPALLRQAILNLLIYVTEIAPDVHIILAGADSTSGVVLRILPDPARRQDSRGLGMATSVAPRLFNAARQILETQGGTVDLDPDSSANALIRVVLPPIQLRKLLVVDDNPDVVGLFRRYLRDQPYRLLQAMSGRGALRLAKELHPDLIILDVLIPSQDGWEILQQLRNEPETTHTRVIICSVLPEQALAVSLGVSEFLPKPVTRQALLAVLEPQCPGPRESPVRF